MEIIFSHGRGSSANGRKIVALNDIASARGLKTHRVNDEDCDNPDTRADRLIGLVKTRQNPVILVGSSMGGYTSLQAAPHCADLRGVFLIAPALFLPNYAEQNFKTRLAVPIEIVHGWGDEVVPWQNALRYAEQVGATLHLIPGDHRLHAEQAEINAIFTRFLEKLS